MRHRLVPFAVVIVLLAARSAPAATIAEWGRALTQPALVGAGADAAGKKLRYGHLELDLRDGRLTAVKVMGQVVGAWFTGHGSFRYVSADPLEQVVFRKNLEDVTDYSADAGAGFGDSIDAALIWLSSGAESLGPSPEWLDGQPAAAALESFARHREEWAEDRGWSAETSLPQALVEAPATPLVLIELEAQKHDLVHVHDPIYHQDEDIFRVWKVENAHSLFKGWRVQQLISEQPIGRNRLDPRWPRFRLVEVAGTLVNTSDTHAEVAVREVVEALAPLRTIELTLMADRVGDSGARATLKRAKYELAKVTDASGNSLPFWHRRGQVAIELKQPLAKGERVELRFDLAGDILFRPNNDNYWDLGDDWFPTAPRRDMEAYSYHAVVKVPRPWLAFSSGRTERRWEEGELACAEFRAAGPVQGAVLLAGKYATHTEKRGPLTVRVSSYGALDKPEAKKRIAGLAFNFIEFYQPLLGEFPWTELDIVEINSYGFGVAPPGIIFITKEAFVSGMMDDTINYVIQGINARIAHEVAHAWWGNSTLLGSSEENWMWEATAEYYAQFAMGKLKGKKEFDQALDNWRRNAEESAKNGSILLANQLAGEESGIDRIRLLYNKGPVVLHALREEVGDDTFFTILKSFQRSFRGKPAYTRDLIGLASFVTKKDMRPFFDRYVLGTELPQRAKK